MVNFERGLQAAGLDQSIGVPYWYVNSTPQKRFKYINRFKAQLVVSNNKKKIYKKTDPH